MQHYFDIQKSHSTSDVPDKKRVFKTTDISPIFKTPPLKDYSANFTSVYH